MIDTSGKVPEKYALPCSGPMILKVVIEDEKPWSNNQWWSGKHRSERTKYKNRVAGIARSALPHDIQMGENPMFPYKMGRVDVMAIIYCESHPIDADNVSVKPYIDAWAKKSMGESLVLEGDGIKHLRRFVGGCEIDKENPRLEITFYLAIESEAQMIQEAVMEAQMIEQLEIIADSFPERSGIVLNDNKEPVKVFQLNAFSQGDE